MKKLIIILSTSLLLAALPVDPNIKVKTGIASIYHPKLQGSKTSTGEIFSHKELTVASNNYPLGTKLKVVNFKDTSKWVIVRVNDRMAKSMSNKGRIVDVSLRAAEILGFGLKQGLLKIKVYVHKE